jgi:hypothetical protein
VLDFHPPASFYPFGTVVIPRSVSGGAGSLYLELATSQALSFRGAVRPLVFTHGWLFLIFATLFDVQLNEPGEVQIRE